MHNHLTGNARALPPAATLASRALRLVAVVAFAGALSACGQATPKSYGVFAADGSKLTPLTATVRADGSHNFHPRVQVVFFQPTASDLTPDQLAAGGIYRRSIVRLHVTCGGPLYAPCADPVGSETASGGEYIVGERVDAGYEPDPKNPDIIRVVTKTPLQPGSYVFVLPGSADDKVVFDVGVAKPLTVGNGVTGCVDRFVQKQFGSVVDTKYFSCGYKSYVAGNLALIGEHPDVKAALAHYAEAIRLDPREGVTYALMGELYFDQDRYQEAAEHFSRGLALSPAMPRALMGRAAAYIKLGKEELAVADLQVAREHNPDLSAGPSKIDATIRPVADRLIGRP